MSFFTMLTEFQWRLGFTHAMQEHAKGLQQLLDIKPVSRSGKTSAVLDLLVTAASSR
jgi:hypothetical protein